MCTTEGWKEYTIQTDKVTDIRSIGIGLHVKGTGHLLIDQIAFKTRTGDEEWGVISLNTPIVAQNQPEFSDGLRLLERGGPYDYKLETNCSARGGSSLRIDSPPQLFRDYPQVGETVLKNLGDGLWSEVPLALYRNENHTLPQGDGLSLQELQKELDTIDLAVATVEDEDVRLANIIITWNIFQHFYPYFDVIETDWERQLTHSVQRALTDMTIADFERTWGKMLASLHDGHIRQDLHGNRENLAGFPFIIDWIEDQLVITHSADEHILPGDIIRSVDGVPAEEIVADREELISGSPQFTRFRSLRQFGLGQPDSDAQISIERKGVLHEFTVSRSDRSVSSWTANSSTWTYDLEKAHLPVIKEIEESLFYVDLTRASITQIRADLEEIATAQGVIFDLRGYPNSNHDVLRHLLADPDTSDQWMQIPQFIYPDQQNITGYDKRRWYLQPASPHIEGKVVFITDARAISYAESFLSYVEHYKLGEIVGQPTAGTNGTINLVNLPGGYHFYRTGMKVLKHDGSQHHLIGIQPTVHVDKTIEGVREGKDEFLEKAIEILQ